MPLTVQATPWTRPLRAPFLEVAISPIDGSVFRWTPMAHYPKATRLCLPADWTNNKLRGWNQQHIGEVGSAGGSPWKSQGWTSNIDGRVGQLLINSGTSVVFQRLGYSSPSPYYTPLSWVGQFNWTHNKASNFYRYEFYIDNDLEETDPTVIIDDGGVAFWVQSSWGTGSIGNVTEFDDTAEKAKGANSYRIEVGSGSNAKWQIYHDFNPNVDWSNKNFICFYVYGTNNGNSLSIRFGDNTNFHFYVITDNFSGWKRFVIPFNAMSKGGTGADLSDVSDIRFISSTDNDDATRRFDRIVVDVGQWATVEAWVPDSVRVGDAGTCDGPYSCALYNWAWGGWALRSRWSVDATRGWSGCQGSPVFLGDFSEIYTPDYQGIIAYVWGERGESKSYLWTFGGPTTPITYSAYYGCKKRIGFAVKMPPDDGQDSSTTGISQCKIKLEIYYADDGKATYEFANTLDTLYGLQSMNEAWLASFDLTAKRVEYLILSKRPTGMTVRADENELIDRVDLTLAKGTRIFAGELTWSDLTRDADGDTVPDFLSGGKPTVEVAPTVLYDDNESFWTTYKSGSGSYTVTISEETTEVMKGTSSLKAVIGVGTYSSIQILHNFSPNANWSTKKYLSFYFYGANTGLTWYIYLICPDWSNYKRYNLIDNFAGWKRVIFPFDNPSSQVGSPDLSNVATLSFQVVPNAGFTNYIDRTIIDVESPIGIPYLVSQLFQEGYP